MRRLKIERCDEVVAACHRALSALRGRGRAVVFDCGGHRFGYICHDSDFPDWFAPYFAGYMREGRPGPGDLAVYSTCDPNLLELLRLAAPVDSGDERPVVSLGEGIEIVNDRQAVDRSARDVFYVFFPRERDLLVVSESSGPELRLVVARLVRSLMTVFFAADGWVHYHAGACTVNGMGVCVTGDKYAGKTTTVLGLIEHPGSAFIANDKIMLRCNGGSLEVIGMPHKVGIRERTLVRHSRVLKWVEQAHRSVYAEVNFAAARRIAERAGNRGGNSEQEDEILLLPPELSEAVGAPLQQQMHARIFLLPTWMSGEGRPQLVPVSDVEATALLEAQVLPIAETVRHLVWQALPDHEALRRYFSNMLQRAASAVRVYRLFQDEATLREGAELVAQLTRTLQEESGVRKTHGR